MSNWTEHGLSQSLVEASKHVMKMSGDAEYQALVKKCMKDMGIDDLGKADDETTKKLFNKVDSMWNSDDEKGKDGLKEMDDKDEKDHEDKEDDDKEDKEELDESSEETEADAEDEVVNEESEELLSADEKAAIEAIINDDSE